MILQPFTHFIGGLQPHHLEQEVTLSLPLGTVLRLGNGEAPAPSTRLDALKKRGPWLGEKGLHGIYAGVARGYGGEKDGVLEVLDEAPARMAWEAAKKWAEEAGGRLPTRKEAALLFANVPELFKEEAYWTCEQYAGTESYAWFQAFDHGHQDASHKSYERRASAVRRLPFE